MTRLEVSEVLVYHGEMDPETGGRIAKETGCLVIALPDGDSLETVDETQMREAGWVKAT